VIGYNSGTNESGRAVFEAPPTVASERVRSRMRYKSIPLLTPVQLAKVWARVDVYQPAGCWEWRGAIGPDGYGKISFVCADGKSRVYKAHRLVYDLLIGDFSPDLAIDHLCRNRSCVNPDHLQQVTLGENTRRGYAPSLVWHRVGVCRYGHNDYRIERDGERNCRICGRDAQRRYRARKKAATP
jgi:hypothetical protein